MKRSSSILLSAVLMSFTMALGGCSDSTTRQASGSDFQRSQPIELRQVDDGLVTVMAVNHHGRVQRSLGRPGFPCRG